jgi:hypothetical protein
MLADQQKEKTNVIMAAVQLRKEIEEVDETKVEHRKQNLKAAGAIIYADYKIQQMQSEQAVILKHLKDSEAYKEEGYTKFSDYVSNELGICNSKADELIRQIHKLGEPNYVALNKIGVGYRAMMALRKGIDEERVETDDEGEVIEIEGEIVEIKPENKGRIKDLIKKMTDTTKDLKEALDFEYKAREEVETKLEKATTIRDLELEEYTDECNAFALKIQGELNKLGKMHKQAKLSHKKSGVFEGLMHNLIAITQNAFDYYMNGIIDTEDQKTTSKKKK